MSVDLAPGRISPLVALKAVAAVAERWRIPKGERYALLGVSESTANHWFSSIERGEFHETQTINRTTLERASHIVSIYDGLHRLIQGESINGSLADVWIKSPNRAFGGRTPYELLRTGRIDDLMTVRMYVDREVQR